MLQRLNIIGLLMTLFAVTGTAYSAVTPISGTITEDTVWTAAGGPYRVVGAITVAPGATLTIEGGAIADGEAAEIQFLSNLLKSHKTHFDQTGKGPGITDCNVCHNAKFKDNEPLETTTVCDQCHSPTGSFGVAEGLMDPVIGAKANFALGGVYEIDNETLKPGKEKWCSTCHDSAPSVNSLGGFPETSAPNVVGDNATFGFWQTGHGKSIGNCLECHDASKDHWDFEARTYEVDEATNTVINGWGDSYRLRTSNTRTNDQLCLKCHDQGALRDDNGQSNYKNLQSGHDIHIWSNTFSGLIADTDYDGVNDSRPGCTTCHNPHGSKSNKMTRTGELSSTPGTTDREPALDQIYVKTNPGPFSTAAWRPNLPSSGTFGVYGQWIVNGGYSSSADFTIHHSGGSTTVSINQRAPEFVDGWASLGSYDFQAGTTGYVELREGASTGKIVADIIGFDTTGDGVPDVIIDDADPEFSSIDMVNGGEWPYNAWADGKVIDYYEDFIPAASLEESDAGYVQFGSALPGLNKITGSNNTCDTCHGAIVYERTPFMGPKVLNRFEETRWALNDGNGVAEVTVSVVDPNDDMSGGSVVIDASILGGGSADTMTDNGDNTFSYQIAIPQGTEDRSYALPITATDVAGNVGTNMNASVFVKSSDDHVYLDNIDAVILNTNNWNRDTLNSASYRGSFISTFNLKGLPDEDIEASWEAPVGKAGTYNVYAWLYEATINNQDAVYTVLDSDGSTAVPLNQNTGPAGGGWTLIGSFRYDEGATAKITLNGSNFGFHNLLYVDAIKLELAP